MSESLLERISDLAEDRTPEAIKDLVSAGLELARNKLDGGDLEGVERGLLLIGSRADEFAHLGAEGVVVLLTLFGLGGPNEAALEFLRVRADFEERRTAMHESTAATVRAATDRAQFWGSLESALESLGPQLLKLIPVLLAVA